MKRLIGVLFFLITSILCEAQLQEAFTIKKIIVGEQHKNDFSLYPYLFNYEMDSHCVKQGDFDTYFLSETNDTTLIANGKYKSGGLYDTCRWFSIGKNTLYAKAFFKEDSGEYRFLFTVCYSGYTLCEAASREGLFELYYPDTTKLKERSTYMDGKLNGTYERYHLNGQLAAKYEYSNGSGNGPFIEYDDKGFLQKKGYTDYKSDEAYGETYSDNGQVRTEVRKSSNGRIIYDSCMFKDGTVSYKQYYNGAKGDSLFRYYFGGQLKFEMILNAKGDGYLKSYYENGNIKDYTPFKNRDFDGTVIEYYESGNKKIEKNWLKGSIHGKYTEYYETGIVKEEGMHLEYRLEGLKKEYHKNGKLASSSYYSNGFLNGPRQEYNVKGQLTRNSLYENGLLISEKFYENGKEIIPVKAKPKELTFEAVDGDTKSSTKTWFYEPEHSITIDESTCRDCSAFPHLKPVFNRDTFLTHFKNYLTTPEGKSLKKISKTIDFHITTTENSVASAGQYCRIVSNVTYHTALNKKQQNAFLQFLLGEKLVYNDSSFKNSVYKLDYELSIIPNALK